MGLEILLNRFLRFTVYEQGEKIKPKLILYKERYFLHTVSWEIFFFLDYIQ